jgi:hypothetical protein
VVSSDPDANLKLLNVRHLTVVVCALNVRNSFEELMFQTLMEESLLPEYIVFPSN